MALTLLAGCRGAPQINLLGSFFPAWMLCVGDRSRRNPAAAPGLCSRQTRTSPGHTPSWFISALGAAYARVLADLLQGLTYERHHTITEPSWPRSQRALIRKRLGKILSMSIIVGAGIVSLLAIWVYVHQPETDDATVRANFVGIAPHASGHIVELPVRDNQSVREGDLLFVVDPRPYEHAVALAKARLALTRKEVAALQKAVQVAEASIGRAEAQVNASAADITRAEAQSVAAEASLDRAQGQFKEADNHFHRLEPLLAKQLTTPDLVEAAETRRLVAETGVREAQKALIAARSVVEAARAQKTAAEAALEQAKDERLRAEDVVGQEGNINARISQAEAQLAEAELDLNYCYVHAPFTGKVVDLEHLGRGICSCGCANLYPGRYAKVVCNSQLPRNPTSPDCRRKPGGSVPSIHRRQALSRESRWAGLGGDSRIWHQHPWAAECTAQLGLGETGSKISGADSD